jgi:hypothetical protein
MTDREPVAWATFYPNGSTEGVYAGIRPPNAEPLYRLPALTDEERDALTLAWMNLSETARVGLKKGHSEETCEPLRSASHAIRKLLNRIDKNCDTSQPPVA